MSAEVIEFSPGVLGDGAVIDPDKVLEAAKGDFTHVVVLGWDKNGELNLRSSHGSRETLWLLRKAECHLLFETC